MLQSYSQQEISLKQESVSVLSSTPYNSQHSHPHHQNHQNQHQHQHQNHHSHHPNHHTHINHPNHLTHHHRVKLCHICGSNFSSLSLAVHQKKCIKSIRKSTLSLNSSSQNDINQFKPSITSTMSGMRLDSTYSRTSVSTSSLSANISNSPSRSVRGSIVKRSLNEIPTMRQNSPPSPTSHVETSMMASIPTDPSESNSRKTVVHRRNVREIQMNSKHSPKDRTEGISTFSSNNSITSSQQQSTFSFSTGLSVSQMNNYEETEEFQYRNSGNSRKSSNNKTRNNAYNQNQYANEDDSGIIEPVAGIYPEEAVEEGIIDDPYDEDRLPCTICGRKFVGEDRLVFSSSF